MEIKTQEAEERQKREPVRSGIGYLDDEISGDTSLDHYATCRSHRSSRSHLADGPGRESSIPSRSRAATAHERIAHLHINACNISRCHAVSGKVHA